MSSLTAVDIVNLVASATSILLGWFAIWLAFMFFRSSNTNEKNTEIAVNRISDATSTLSRLSMRIINKLTSALVDRQENEKPLATLLKEANDNGLLTEANDGKPDGTFTKEQTEQFRIDNLIAALYYAGLSNLALQVKLPESIADIETSGQANLVDQSYADYHTLKGWILAAKNSQEKIDKSPVKHLYNQILEGESMIRSVKDFYAHLASTEPAA